MMVHLSLPEFYTGEISITTDELQLFLINLAMATVICAALHFADAYYHIKINPFRLNQEQLDRIERMRNLLPDLVLEEDIGPLSVTSSNQDISNI